MIILRILLPALFWILISVVSAFSAVISGRITESKNSRPIEWASVILEGTGYGSPTDEQGYYEIKNVPPGAYKIIITQLGYHPLVKTIEIKGDEIATFDFELKETPLQLEGVVVTGTQTPRFIKDAPVRTEVITRQDIIERGAHDLYEVLERAPGIRVEQQCQFCNFSVLRMQGLGADHTQILLDGQPVYSGLASVYGLQQVSAVDIDRIEVVKGAGSALYGSNAIAGAINIISSRPRGMKGTIGLELGEHNTNKFDITAGAQKNNLGVFLFAQYERDGIIDETGDGLKSDDVRQPDGISDRVKTDDFSAGFNLFIENAPHLDEIVFRGRVINEKRQGGPLTDDIYENPFNEGVERIITDHYSLDLKLSKKLPAGNELNFDLAYARHERNATNDTFVGDYKDTHDDRLPPLDMLRPYKAFEDLYVGTLNYYHPLGYYHRLMAGAQLSFNQLDESGLYVIVDDTDPNYGESYTSYTEKQAVDIGAYVQDEFQVADNLEIVGGVRLDFHNSEDSYGGGNDNFTVNETEADYDASTVNPRFAVRYTVTPQLTLRTSLGTGFRVPYGFSEDLHLCSGSPRVFKGGNLEPEKSVSYSIAADYAASGLGFSLNLYRTELKNAINLADAGERAEQLGFTYEWRNIDDAFVMGAEMTLQTALRTDLTFEADFAFNLSEYDHVREDWIGTPYEEDSKKISRYPETSGGFKINFSPGDWDFVLNSDYQGKMYIYYFQDDEIPTKIKQTEPHILLHTNISRTILDYVRLYAGVKNITDYIQEEKHIDDAAFMYAPVYGRIFYGGIQITVE
jgi:outer membrane receptor for ferrienterochelin and colicins